MSNSIKDSAQAFAVNQVLKYVDSNPQEALINRNDNTSAVLGFEEDGHPFMIENTPESKRNMNRYFACLNEWANWGEPLETISPNDYPADIKKLFNCAWHSQY